VSWIHNVVPFPTEAILSPVLNNEKTDLQALGDIARWVAPLVKEPWISSSTGLIPNPAVI